MEGTQASLVVVAAGTIAARVGSTDAKIVFLINLS